MSREFTSVKKQTGPPRFMDPKKILDQVGLEEGWQVADLGCGSGFLTFEAARVVGDSGKVFAVDIQKTVLSVIKSKIKFLGLRNVTPCWANLEILGSTKIAQGSIDLAILTNVLFQSKKHREIFEEAKRILKKKGRFLVIDWRKEGVLFGPSLSFRISKEEAKNKAEAAGFKFIKEVKTDDYHWGLLFER